MMQTVAQPILVLQDNVRHLLPPVMTRMIAPSILAIRLMAVPIPHLTVAIPIIVLSTLVRTDNVYMNLLSALDLLASNPIAIPLLVALHHPFVAVMEMNAQSTAAIL
jgi:hypothetical protein